MQDFTTLLHFDYFNHILVNSVACVYWLHEMYLAQWVTLHKIQPFYLGGRGSLIVHARTTWLHALCRKIAVHIFMPGLWKQVLRNEWLFKTCSKCGSLIASQSSMHVYKLEDLELKICLQGFLYEDVLIRICVAWFCIFATYQFRVALVASSWQRCLEIAIQILRKSWLK